MSEKLRVFSFVIITVVILSFVGVTVSAVDNSVLSFKIEGDNAVVYACDVNASGEVVIPETYNGKVVTTIATSAFLNCEKIEKISIPDTVAYIGDSAFERCLALKEITIPKGVTAINDSVFCDCINLRKVVLPDGIKSIGREAFYNAGYDLEIVLPDSVTELKEGCFLFSKITSINIPKNVKVIPKEAFSGCGHLESLIIPEGVIEIGEEALGGGAYFSTINIPSTVTKIGKRAFLSLANLETITVDKNNPSFSSLNGVLFNKNKTELLCYASRVEKSSYVVPQTVTSIGEFAFEYNDWLVDVTLPTGLKSIGFGAFTCCRSLENINLPNSLTSLGQGVFTRCYALKKISVPESITVLPENLFYCCESLEEIDLPSNLTSIGGEAFNGTKYMEDKSNWVDGLLYIDNYLIVADRTLTGHVDVRKGTTLIADYAFSLCSYIESVKIPDGIKRIPYATFLFCLSLVEISIPESVQYIDSFSFSLTDVVERIIYRGSPEKWDKIKIDETEKEFFKKVKVYCDSFSAPVVKISNNSKGVLVTWSRHINVDKVVVYRSELVNGKWSSWKNMGSLSANVVSWSDNTVKSGTIYKYTVRLVKNGKYSPFKASASLTYLSQPTVKISNSATGIKVSWTKSGGATHYAVYRSVSTGLNWSNWELVADVSSASTSWNDTKAENARKYRYTVVALNDSGRSSYTKSNDLVSLSQPTVSYSNVSTGIKVSWSRVESATGYRVYRSVYSGGKWSSWKNMGTAAASKTSWVDGSAESGKQYKYTVRAVNGNSVSWFVNSAGTLCLSEPLVGTEKNSSGITLRWTKSNGATGYRIYRAVYSDGKWSSWKLLGTLGANRRSWIDKNINATNSYKYTVRAVCGGTLSSYTKTENYYKLSRPQTKISNAQKGISVSWNIISGARSYNIYRSEYKNGKWTSWAKVTNVNSAKSSWVDSNVNSGKIYKYTVRALNENVISSYKATNALMNLATPVFNCEGDWKTGITLYWEKVNGASEYYIYRKVDNETKWTRIAVVKGTSYLDKAINDDGKCTYTIRARNGANLSSYKTSGTTISLNFSMDVLRLVNEERRKAGLNELQYCHDLQDVVDLRTEEVTYMFSHTRPDGTTFETALDESGIDYYLAAENIAKGIKTPEQVMNAWMNSEGHKANILCPYVSHMAVGYIDGVWVQIFIDSEGLLGIEQEE